jgi:peptidoglycan/xylan/chitin deacetylase (PgdA/CDA1 family)
MSPSQVQQVSRSFEIGGHSVDHVVLTQLPIDELHAQIGGNKRWLESVIGKPITGFCYVRGQYNRNVKTAVQQLGYTYARTTENLRAEPTNDLFELPTTLQLYPHTKATLMRNSVRGRTPWKKLRLLRTALGTKSLVTRVEKMINECVDTGGYFHLWGHSWEIEEQNLWSELEHILRHLTALGSKIVHLTNHDACRALQQEQMQK